MIQISSISYFLLSASYSPSVHYDLVFIRHPGNGHPATAPHTFVFYLCYLREDLTELGLVFNLSSERSWADLTPETLLLLDPECWDSRCVAPCPASSGVLMAINTWPFHITAW